MPLLESSTRAGLVNLRSKRHVTIALNATFHLGGAGLATFVTFIQPFRRVLADGFAVLYIA